MQQSVLDQVPDPLGPDFLPDNASLFDATIKYVYDLVVHGQLGSGSTEFRWLIDQRLWSFNTNSPFTWLTEIGKFSLEGIYESVTCPVFIGDGQHDTLTRNQA